jgi:hypothetical protein
MIQNQPAKELDDFYTKTGKLVGPLHGTTVLSFVQFHFFD